MDGLDTIGAQWFWFALAALMGALEFAVPSRALIWMAGAAVLTGIVAWLWPLGPAVESVIFAALALVAAFAGRIHIRRSQQSAEASGDQRQEGATTSADDDPLHLVGQKARVSAEIIGGEGRVFIAGSEWVAHGPDTHAGVLVTVVGREDAVLLVE